jgi:drug/metabolite transporter (DMT)-like permease
VSNIVKAILLTTASMALFTVLDTSGKYITQSLPLPVGVFFRYFFAFVMSAAVVMLTSGRTALTTRHPFLQVLRAAFLLASTFCNFFAMQYLQLAQVAAISFTIPLLVCALSVPLLGEHVGVRRWLAVVVGFCGVLVVMRPGSDSFHWAMLVSLGNALLGALYNITTRKVGARDMAETSLFYVCLFGALGATGPMLAQWQTPVGWQWLPLVLMGLAGAVGHYMLIQAHRLAPASAIAPFIYTQIIWMIIAGSVVFGQLPDFWTLVGAAIVVACGIYVFSRERQLGVATTATTPAD